MTEQGCSNLNDPIQFIAEFFEVEIENKLKSIPPDFPTRNNKKKNFKKKKAMTFKD